MSAHGDRGQGLVEFALILPLLLVLLVGIFDVGRAVFASSALTAAVREGTHHAIVTGDLSVTPSDAAAIDSVVQRYTTGVGAPVAVSTSWPDGDALPGSRVMVSATSPFTPVLSSVFTGGGLQITLRSSSTMVVLQ